MFCCVLVRLSRAFFKCSPLAEPFGTRLLERGRKLLFLDSVPLFFKLAVALFLSFTRDGQALASARLVNHAPSEAESIPPGTALRPLAALAARWITPFRVARAAFGTRYPPVQTHSFISLLAQAALDFFDRGIRAKAHDDPEIVEEAWQSNRTIVTSNRRDFVRHVRQFQRRENNREFRDLWGLVAIPNLHLLRGKGLKDIKHGLLAIASAERLRWPGVGFLNLYVHVTDDQKVGIRRFERCSFCERMLIRDPWAHWYRSLPVIGSRVEREEVMQPGRR